MNWSELPHAKPEQVPNFGPIPDAITEIAQSEASEYHAFMVEHGEPETLPWDLMEIAFYSGFCKAFNYTRAALARQGTQP